MIPISDFAWTEQQFMQLVSTFADVYFEGVSAPLESICYLGPYAWYIKENEIKQAKQKSKTKQNKTKKAKQQQQQQQKKNKKNKKNNNNNKQTLITKKRNRFLYSHFPCFFSWLFINS